METIRLVISATDPGVSDFIRYMADAHQLPLYLTDSPFDLREATPVGALTKTERSTLDTISALGRSGDSIQASCYRENRAECCGK